MKDNDDDDGDDNNKLSTIYFSRETLKKNFFMEVIREKFNSNPPGDESFTICQT